MKQEPYSYLIIFLVVIFYWSTSITMTFANKYLVGHRFNDIKEDISLFVAWIQCTMTTLIIFILYLIKRFIFGYKNSRLPPVTPSIIFNLDMIQTIVSFSIMLSLNNITLKYVGVAFFQIARSLTLVFTLILTRILLRQTPSLNCILSCFVIVFGFFLGIDQEKVSGNLSWIGLILGILSSACVASTGIFMKRVMENMKQDSYSLVFYLNFGSVVLYFPLLIVFNQFEIVFRTKIKDPWFNGALVLTGCLGFLINLASNLEIDCTSPLTHQISNNAKSVLQTILAIIIFKDYRPLLWWFSNFIIISGAIAYTLVKYLNT